MAAEFHEWHPGNGLFLIAGQVATVGMDPVEAVQLVISSPKGLPHSSLAGLALNRALQQNMTFAEAWAGTVEEHNSKTTQREKSPQRTVRIVPEAHQPQHEASQGALLQRRPEAARARTSTTGPPQRALQQARTGGAHAGRETLTVSQQNSAHSVRGKAGTWRRLWRNRSGSLRLHQTLSIKLSS